MKEEKVREENGCTHYVRNRSSARSWIASSESASSLKGKVAEEGPKKNRRAIHPFEHLFGMPLAPSSTLPYFFLSLFLLLVYSRIPPSDLFLASLRSPCLSLHLVFLVRFAKCGVPSSWRFFRPSSQSEGLKPAKLRNHVTQ